MATGLETLTIQGPGTANDQNAGGRQTLPRIISREIGGTTYQVIGYISSTLKLVLGWRIYPFGGWTLYHYDGTDETDLGTTTLDPHYAVAVAIDADGLVHVAWGHHNTALQYRRSDAALGTWTGGVTAAQSMLGTNESSVTYPMFFVSPVGKLYFTFRDGISGAGDQYFYKWDDSIDTWSAAVGAAGKLINGNTSSVNPYLNGPPKFTSDWDGAGTGRMHISWEWRDDPNAQTNHDVLHALWDGTLWTKIDGSSQTVPITAANCDTAATIATGTGLLQGDFDVDSNGNPVIVISKTVSTVDQYIAIYRSGGAWTSTQVSSFSSGTGQTSIATPIVVVDRATNLCYILGGLQPDSSTDVQQFTSGAADYSSWAHSTYYSQTGFGGTYPSYDRTLWLDSATLCMLIAPWPQASSLGYCKVLEQKPQAALSFPSAWTRRHPIIVDATKVGTGGVADFSVLLTRACFDNEVFDPSGSFTAQSDGGDLVFTSDANGSTRLPCHVIRFELDSSTGAADAEVEIYVNVPSLSSAANTTFYVWYKPSVTTAQPGVGSTYGQFAAYDSRPIFFPLSKRLDSVSQDQVFARRNPPSQPTSATGKILEGISPSAGVSRGLVLENPSIAIASAFSISAWVSVGAAPANFGFILVNNSSAASDRILDFGVFSTDGKIRLERYDSSQTLIVTVTGTSDLRNAGFKRVWATFDTTDGSAVFVNATSEATEATLTANRSPLGAHISIGHRTTENDFTFDGVLDNVEFHSVRRTQAWITTDYNNQNGPSTFASPDTPSSFTSATQTFQAFIFG